MGSARFEKLLAGIAVMVSLLSLFPLGPEAASTGRVPDLAVEGMDVSALETGYQVNIRIRNTGNGTSGKVISSLWDEYDLYNGDESLIAQFTVPDLRPSDDYAIDLKWEPSHQGPHRLWVVLDVNGELLERTKGNNQFSMLFTLPGEVEVLPELDGDPDPDVIGTFFSGVDLEQTISVQMPEGHSLELDRVYIGIDDRPQELPLSEGGGLYRRTLGVGDLGPGHHTLEVNASRSRIPLPSKEVDVSVRSVPGWVKDLKGYEARFDRDLGAYRFEGFIDIPTSTIDLEMEWLRNMTQLTLFGSEHDLGITLLVLLDGTTTLLFKGGCRVECGGWNEWLPLNGSMFLPDLLSGGSVVLQSAGGSVFDVAADMEFDQGSLEGYQGPAFSLPVMVRMSVGFRTNVEVKLYGMDQGPSLTVWTGMELEGSSKTVHAPELPGFDMPVMVANLSMEISSDLRMQGTGEWTDSRTIGTERSLAISDVGGAVAGEARLMGMPFPYAGSATVVGPDAEPAFLTFSRGQDNVTKLLFSNMTDQTMVVESSRYMSSPQLAFIDEGGSVPMPLTLWTGATEGPSGPSPFTVPLHLFYSLGDVDGTFDGLPIMLWNGSHSDHRPFIATPPSPGALEAAIVWERDLDGNLSGTGDSCIMASFFTAGNWTLPDIVTSDGTAFSPSCGFGNDGELWAFWMDSNGSAGYRVFDTDAWVWGAEGTILAPGGGRFMSLTCSRGSFDQPILSASIWSNGSAPRSSVWAILIDTGTEEVTYGLVSIGPSDALLMSPCLFVSPTWGASMIWRSMGADGSELYLSADPFGPSEHAWSEPLRMTDGPGVELWHSAAPTEGGSFGIVYRPIGPSEEGDSEPPYALTEPLVTGVARIISIEPADNATAPYGELLNLKVRVRNVGMDPVGTAWVTLRRISLDEALIETYLDSKLVTFNGLDGTGTVYFDVAVEERQLGFSASVDSPQTGAPYYSSSSFLSISCIPDPVIEGIGSGDVGPGGSATVTVEVSNRGAAPLRGGVLRLLAEGPGPMLGLNGTFLEPLHIRDPSRASEVNRTAVNLDPGSSYPFSFNLTLGPGTTVIWANLEGTSDVYGPLVLRRYPAMSFKVQGGPVIVHGGNVAEVVLGISGNSLASLNESNATGGDMPYPLIEKVPKPVLSVVVMKEGADIISELVPFAPPSADNATEIRYLVPPQVVMDGPIRVEATLISGVEGAMGRIDRERATVVVQPVGVPSVGIGKVEGGSRPGMGAGLFVLVNNTSNRTVRSLRVVLYNGLMRDDVVLSDALAVGLGPGEGAAVFLPNTLGIGSFLLTLAVIPPSTPQGPVYGSGQPIAVWTFEREMVESTAPEREDEGRIDMDEVADTAMISGIMVMLVLFIAFLFRRNEDEVG